MAKYYIETYVVDEMIFGIEDHKDGRPDDEHFFHHQFTVGERQRFVVWRGGCSFGQFDSLDEARVAVRDRALLAAVQKVDDSLAAATQAATVVDALKVDDIFKLATFLVVEPHTITAEG